MPRDAGKKPKRIDRSLVALSSAAIVAVYAAGYLRTESAAQQIQSRQGSYQALPGAQGVQRLKDGTYTGRGSSRRGDITATVVVRNGRIESADIAECATTYPCSVISELPSEVVASQGTNVDMVSRATDSSEAYLGAVADALSQAQ